MKEKVLYIMAGCNGAGKTTASYTILPEILDCKEFVNADLIAKGLSPFQPEAVAFEAGRIMIERVDSLLLLEDSFALETTLSTRSYKNKLIQASANGFKIVLLFFWLPTVEMAVNRVAKRVSEGGHNIPTDVIERRYFRGIENLFKIYIPLCDQWYVFENSKMYPKKIAEGNSNNQIEIVQTEIWESLNSQII